MNRARLFVIVEACVFFAAALTHFGILGNGYQHQQAGRAETAIAIVLFAGWISMLSRSSWTHRIGLGVQAFALFGTLVGIFTIAVGVGPRTALDLIYHGCMIVLLLCGLTITMRARRAELLLYSKSSKSRN